MERPSWLLDVPAEEYHQATKENRYLSSHRLDVFRRCPLEYKQRVDGIIVEKDTADFALGRATHVRILEGRAGFEAGFGVGDGPMNDKTGKPYGSETLAYRAWAEQQTKPVISTANYALIEKMAESVWSHKMASELLGTGGFAEGTVRTTWEGKPVQARLDYFDPVGNVIVDLKTTKDLDRFAYDIRDYGYIHQLAFYAQCVTFARSEAGAKKGENETPKCYLVAVEKREPYRVGVTHILPFTIDDANFDAEGKWGLGNFPLVYELMECERTDVWPTRYEDIKNI